MTYRKERITPPERITATALEDILHKHEIWLDSNQAKGTQAHLLGKELSTHNLDGRRLHRADLRRSHISDMDNTDLSDADGRGTIFSFGVYKGGTNFSGMRMNAYTNFDFSDLSKAKVRKEDFINGNVSLLGTDPHTLPPELLAVREEQLKSRMRREDFERLLHAHEAWRHKISGATPVSFRGKDIRWMDISGKDLSLSDLNTCKVAGLAVDKNTILKGTAVNVKAFEQVDLTPMKRENLPVTLHKLWATQQKEKETGVPHGKPRISEKLVGVLAEHVRVEEQKRRRGTENGKGRR